MSLTEFNEAEFVRNRRAEGRIEGLKALVHTLEELLPDFSSVYETITKNEEYQDVSVEQVKKYYKN